MPNLPFEHLHTHSHYSILDGLSTIPSLVERAFELDRTSVCITDHGTIAGVPELFRTAKEYGIKPIAGMEAYICDDVKKEVGKDERAYYHITLLAQNLEGYRNLVRLSTFASLEGFYKRPRIDIECLSKNNRGLILLAGCVGGMAQQAIISGDHVRSGKLIDQFVQIGDKYRFFLEMQDTGLDEQKIVNMAFQSYVKKGLRACATVDSHYTFEHESEAHDALLCIGTRAKLDDPNRFRFNGHGYHYKTPEEMYKLFDPKYLRMTREIADMCEAYDIPKTGGMPTVKIPGGGSPDDYLERMAHKGLKERFKGSIPNKYHNRLEMELDVIKKLGYSSYFVIVADILQQARMDGVFVGPGRGSAAGSLLAYSMGITLVDPIRHNLYFERFLNKDRISPPDIDVDISDEGRDKVLAYVRKKYGESNVAHIGSFATLGPRQALRDVAIASNIEELRVREVLKHVPDDPMIKYEDVRKISAVNEGFGEKIMSLADSLSGKNRHSSTHAAGIIISDKNLYGDIPLVKNKEGHLQTAYDYDELSKLGYIKFDILGLTTLGVIDRTMRNASVSWAEIQKLNDPSTYEMLCTGRTVAIFQLESWGYQQTVKRFQPREFEDIMMINALYRPGPMGGGEGLETVLRRRAGQEIPTYTDMALQPILSGSYGVMVYQEDVMRICVELAGFTLSKADAMRSAISKKKEAEIQALKVEFIRGCVAKGRRRSVAEQIYADIEFFARYGWNKAHAAAYGMVTYATAYLKTHYSDYFMTEMLNSYMTNKDKLRVLLMECRRLGLRFVRSDINKSGIFYKVTEPRTIRCGISSIKGIGEKVAKAIVDERSKWGRGAFSSKEDLRNRLPKKVLNSAMFRLLEEAGAMNYLDEKVKDVPF